MKRTAPLFLLPLILLACQPKTEAPEAPPAEAAAPPVPAPDSPEGKILVATAAGPPSISGAAAVMDWGATPDAPMTELRAGTNGWTCMPDIPTSPGPDPMCLDGVFMQWAGAWMAQKPPNLSGVGVAYMFKGGSDASNNDPFATAPATGEAWVDTGPHIMIAVPNPKSLDGMSDDYRTGGPFVMYKGTPYAHIMVPVR